MDISYQVGYTSIYIPLSIIFSYTLSVCYVPVYSFGYSVTSTARPPPWSTPLHGTHKTKRPGNGTELVSKRVSCRKRRVGGLLGVMYLFFAEISTLPIFSVENSGFFRAKKVHLAIQRCRVIKSWVKPPITAITYRLLWKDHSWMRLL